MADVSEGTLTVAKAVEFTSLSRAELYRLMGSGRLAYLNYGRKRLIPRKALVDLLASLGPR